MNLKTLVKVGNISNLSDARYCAGMGVQLLGFNLDPSDPEHISLDTAREIMGWVSVDDFVFECGTMSVDEILKTKKETGVSFFQIDDPINVSKLKNADCKVILKDAEATDAHPDYILIEDQHELNSTVPILRGFDVSTDELPQILDSENYSGIALKGSIEEKPGFKDYDELADILEFLENEE